MSNSESSTSNQFIRFVLYAVLALVILAIVWATIGILARTYDFWDDDPSRGATTVTIDRFGDSFNQTRYLDQGWKPEDSLWFYTAAQGSNLLPYDFFLELEQADSEELFRSPENINGYRYLPQQSTFSNPDGLPLGMTKDTYDGEDYMGFTCAACHTTQLNYNGTGIRIDGGPSAADLESFMNDLAAAMQAVRDNPAKQQRFIEAVQSRGNYDDADAIVADLEKYTRRLQAYNIVNNPRAIDRPLTRYGYARLDAFGRIYNRVLEHILDPEQLRELLVDIVTPEQREQVLKDIEPILDADERDDLLARVETYLSLKQRIQLRNKIYNPADAPVSYPFLWDIPQHDYVQWNGIVSNAGIGNIGRNAGQVIGVFGTLEWQEKEGINLSSILGGQGFGETHIEFTSSLDIRNLRRVEAQLRDLQSPLWPEDILPAIDRERWEKGRVLFDEYCQGCHQPIDRTSRDRRVIAHMSNIDSVKTDPKMAENSIGYRGYSGILRNQYVDIGIGNLLLQKEAPVAALLTLSTRNVVTTPDPDKIFIQRWAERLFDFAISFFDNDVHESLKQGDYTPDTNARPLASMRSYKGRSLNGIWATAPYLHNGSVPTLYDVLLPKKRPGDAEEGEYRPDEFYVGSREFDPDRVGFRSQGYDGFLYRTEISGNNNGGHEYAAGKTALPSGRMLPALSREQRFELLEYLKSL